MSIRRDYTYNGNKKQFSQCPLAIHESHRKDSEDCLKEVLPEVLTENSNDEEDQDMFHNSEKYDFVNVNYCHNVRHLHVKI